MPRPGPAPPRLLPPSTPFPPPPAPDQTAAIDPVASQSPSQPPTATRTPPRRSTRQRLLRATPLLLVLLGVAAVALWALWILPFTGFPFRSAADSGKPPLTPAWALECWIWEDDANTADAVRELLDGCREHDIPVRTVLIDSPWSTRYNDFIVDPRRYPEPEPFFRSLETNGYRVVLWMTSMVNSRSKDTALQDSPDFAAHARDRGWLAGDGREIRWWKGRGGFLDYSHPDAVAWWHSLQQPVLEWGIDGWKLDGTDTLFHGPAFLPFQRTRAGWMSTRAYMDLYAREEYRHGLRLNPEFIVLTRAIDNRYFPFAHPEGFAPRDAAPVAWIGDRTHEWSSLHGTNRGGADRDALLQAGSPFETDRGFEGALRDVLASSRLRYPVVGADVAGYHGPEPIPPALYIRWAQFATFTGLFLNGGHGERRLWKRSREELEIIRTYAWLHTELVPYLHALVVECHEGGPSMIRPMPGPYHYLLGDALLVAPVYRDTRQVEVTLPPGTWRPLFHPRERLQGPGVVSREVPLHDFPVFVRDGAIIPLHLSRPYTGFTDAASARDPDAALTWLLHPRGRSEFTLPLPDRTGTVRLRMEAPAESGDARQPVTVTISGAQRPHRLRMLRDTPPGRVLRDGKVLAKDTDWTWDAGTGYLTVRSPAPAVGTYRIEPGPGAPTTAAATSAATSTSPR